MWSSVFLHIIISVIIVMIFHYIWIYIKNTFSLFKKTKKDVVNTQIQKYKTIIEELQQNEKNKIEVERFTQNTDFSKTKSMEADLEQFMEQMK